MKILFLGLSDELAKDNQGIYLDLLKWFSSQGHEVYSCIPTERREGKNDYIVNRFGISVLCVKTGNITKCGFIEKGISTLLIERVFLRAIKKHYSGIRFDVVLYATPPITFVNVVKYIKKRDNAVSYLLLKDIFPQNAVDLGVLSKSGFKSLLYYYFRHKEEKLYEISDHIGCMSAANVKYILDHNPQVDPSKLHINPNTMTPTDDTVSEEQILMMKKKYNIPTNATTFIYGGSLGKPQNIDFLVLCLSVCKNLSDRYFVICGSGTGYKTIQYFIENEKPNNVLLINGLPREEYEIFVKAFDIGMIFLDYRFTIPNYPSRLLSYMQNAMPVLACTDPNSDVGIIAEENGYGWHCESNDPNNFKNVCDQAVNAELTLMKQNSLNFFLDHYTTEKSYNIIIDRLENHR